MSKDCLIEFETMSVSALKGKDELSIRDKMR